MDASVLFIHIQPLFLYICPQRLQIRIGAVPLVRIPVCPHVSLGDVIYLQDSGQICLFCRYDLLCLIVLFSPFAFRFRGFQNLPHSRFHPLRQLSVPLGCQMYVICLRQFTASRIQKIHLLCHRQKSIFSGQRFRGLHTVRGKFRIGHSFFNRNRCHDQDLRSVRPPAGNRLCLFHKDLHSFGNLLRIRAKFFLGIIGSQHQDQQIQRLMAVQQRMQYRQQIHRIHGRILIHTGSAALALFNDQILFAQCLLQQTGPALFFIIPAAVVSVLRRIGAKPVSIRVSNAQDVFFHSCASSSGKYTIVSSPWHSTYIPSSSIFTSSTL